MSCIQVLIQNDQPKMYGVSIIQKNDNKIKNWRVVSLVYRTEPNRIDPLTEKELKMDERLERENAPKNYHMVNIADLFFSHSSWQVSYRLQYSQ